MRHAMLSRETRETKIALSLALEGTGKHKVSTGIGFFDHMLELFAAHGRFDLSISCDGDLAVDGHHTVEDTGITLGEAFKTALGEKRGIRRYADITLPMDEALVTVALDISGRAYLGFEVSCDSPMTGAFDLQLLEEFLLALTRSMGLTLHVRQLAGKNSHHIVEAVFKALGRTLSRAVSIDPHAGNEIPSTKGVI